MQKQIEVIIGGEPLSVLVEYKKIKRMYLRVKEDGMLYVTCPKTTTLAFIRSFLKEKEDWIMKTRKKVVMREDKIQTGIVSDEVTWLGKTYHARVVIDAKNRLIIDEEKMEAVFCIREDTDEMRFRVFYDEAAQKLAEMIQERRDEWDRKICVANKKPFPRITIKYMTSRWGSCTPARAKISISLRLIHYPAVCLDYILLHEYAHILEGNHSSRFYAVIEQFMPQWKEYNRLLK